MTRSLSRLLRPRSIAVIGGGVWCENLVKECAKIEFSGDIWPVHPSRDSVGGKPAFGSVSDLPAAPDASFVGVNRRATIDIVGNLARLGAGGAVCFASGFLEASRELGDAEALQDKLLAAAGEMPILGPNCYGLINYLDGAAIWPDQHGGQRVASGVAIITQSSNIAINLTMQRRGLPIAYMVTVGNQAQTSMAEIGRSVLEDDRVTALGLHIEGIGDLRAMEALSEAARELGKPIVALRVGRSTESRAALVSHTASLAGTDVGGRALLKRLGIGELDNLSSFLEALKLLHMTGGIPVNRIASLSCSGGEASLVADTAKAYGVSFPKLKSAQTSALRAVLGPSVALSNPLDYHTHIWGDEAAMAKVFAAMAVPDVALVMVILDFPRSDRCSRDAWMPVVGAARRAQEATDCPFAIVSSLVDTMPEELASNIVENGLIALSGLPEALQAVAVASKVGARAGHNPLILPQKANTPGRTLSEAEAKRDLANAGLQIPMGSAVIGSDQAVLTSRKLGFPVVLKIDGAAHKTEKGGVALNLASPEAVLDAATSMPGERYLVERMVETGVELLVGVTSDPAHGYVLTLGAGGTLTEILKDSASLILPVQRAEVLTALAGLRIAPLLTGYRGSQGASQSAIVEAVLGVQAYVEQKRPIEVEINPLICGPKHATVADALIVLGGEDD